MPWLQGCLPLGYDHLYCLASELSNAPQCSQSSANFASCRTLSTACHLHCCRSMHLCTPVIGEYGRWDPGTRLSYQETSQQLFDLKVKLVNAGGDCTTAQIGGCLALTCSTHPACLCAASCQLAGTACRTVGKDLSSVQRWQGARSHHRAYEQGERSSGQASRARLQHIFVRTGWMVEITSCSAAQNS